jgi:hypothetical protein
VNASITWVQCTPGFSEMWIDVPKRIYPATYQSLPILAFMRARSLRVTVPACNPDLPGTFPLSAELGLLLSPKRRRSEDRILGSIRGQIYYCCLIARSTCLCPVVAGCPRPDVVRTWCKRGGHGSATATFIRHAKRCCPTPMCCPFVRCFDLDISDGVVFSGSGL